MALVQYKDEINNVTITKKMFPPKKVDRIERWFDAARKVIPEIPDPIAQGYGILRTQMTVKWIVWELTSPKGERSYVVIDRSIPSIG